MFELTKVKEESYIMAEILIGNHIKKNLYQETMNLINGNVDEKQFIKDNFYYYMVEEIYKNSFSRIDENAIIQDYVREATDTYKKLDDMNEYFELCFKPDMILLVYVAGQYVNYFKDRKIMQQETENTFAEKLHEALPLCQAAPFERMNILRGRHIRLNDKIYKTKISNEELVRQTGLNRNFIMELRSGRRELTKDIVYMLSLAMRLSWYEFRQLMDTLNIALGDESDWDKLLKEILENLIQFRNLDKNKRMTAVQVANNYLEEKSARSLEIKISTAKKQENVRTVLITGGLGFIGRNCIDYFLKFNEKSNDIKYRICVLTRNRPKPKEIPQGIICYSGQSDNMYVYERIFIENNVDYILHLASASDVEIGENNPAETFNTSYNINVMCEAILSNHIMIKGLIFASSQLVYSGEIDPIKVWKECDPIDQSGLKNYVKAKLMIESELESFAKKGIPVTIVRLANIYGANDKSLNRLIPKTIHLLQQDKAPQIYVNSKTGMSPKKNFLFVKDLAKAFHSIMNLNESKIWAPNAIDNTYNIGSPEAVSVEDIVKLLIKLMRKDIKPQYEKKDTFFRDDKLCVEKAKERIKFTAETSLEEGLKQVLANISLEKQDKPDT